MLSAAVLGLILPSLNYGGTHGILVSIIGIFTGAVCLNLIDKLDVYKRQVSTLLKSLR